MGPRILAVLAALAPATAALTIDPVAEHGYVAPLLAAVLGLALLATRRRALTLVLFGVGMSAIAGVVAARTQQTLAALSAGGPQSWQVHDLTAGPLPDDARGFVGLRGYFRDEWVLDEYGTRAGERPNLNDPARAVLVPFVGTTEGTLQIEGRIVIARVPHGREANATAQTIRGRLDPIPAELLHTLVQVDTSVTPDGARGVMLDTLAVPDPRRAWTGGGATLLCALIALGCFWVASGSRERGSAAS